MEEKLTIRWITRNEATRARVRRKFGLPEYTTVNGFSPVLITSGDDMEMLKECERRGLLAVMPHTWRKNGGAFSFIYR